MTSKFKATDPDGISFTIEITLTLQEWKKLKGALNDSHPGFALQELISRLVDKAEREYTKDEAYNY